MARKKGEVERIRPFEGDEGIANTIAGKLRMRKIDVMSHALSAGLKAMLETTEETGQCPIPPKLKVVGLGEYPVKAERIGSSASEIEDDHFASEVETPKKRKAQ